MLRTWPAKQQHKQHRLKLTRLQLERRPQRHKQLLAQQVVEEGETPEAALVRELQEELGLQVCSSDLTPLSFVSWPYPGRFHLLMPLYSAPS
ncbi:nudix hydrolase domain-containing protein [Haematococcus lacustris]|uniref:Nudix hydrolase domain-containing protein n=1 Tax=Haematococcus lacustris TaxID=44745 RepID=A0A699YIA3_HAELA|nr:nudix hydrolase domain-containing protein [Haematococcus lacustris]